ncbi:MAG: MBL fold metallo-hydrolase [Bacteroidia bacterium]|nr:MBL fold metallo-hydrolase [Bacteroidia bacterium]
MITIKIFEMNPFQVNTYILYDDSKECIIIDAGCYTQNEKKELKLFIEKNGLKPVKLLNTHCHVDHIFGNSFILQNYHISYEAHSADTVILEHARSAAAIYGFTLEENPPAITKPINDNDIIQFGDSSLHVYLVPGHSPGSIVFYNESQKFVIVGDVLFDGSIGRTDLPGGNHEQLINGIRQKLFILSDDVKVYPGHGPITTIGKERRTNPFL